MYVTSPQTKNSARKVWGGGVGKQRFGGKEREKDQWKKEKERSIILSPIKIIFLKNVCNNRK